MGYSTAYFNPSGAMGNPMNFGRGPESGVYNNPSGAMGNPMNMGQSYGPAPIAAPPTAPQQTLQDRIFAEYQKSRNAANAANEARYNELKSLYQNSLNNYGTSGGFQPSANLGQLQNAIGGNAGGTGNALGIGLNKWGAGNLSADSPLWSPQAAAMVSDYTRRGLGDSTYGANATIVGNSMDLARLREQEINNQFQLANAQMNQDRFNYGVQQDATNRRDRLTGDLAGVIERRTDQAPDDSELLRLAFQAGQGNQENMVSPYVAGGSYGPVFANGGYAVPSQSWGTGGSYYAPQKPRSGPAPLSDYGKAQQAKQNQLAYYRKTGKRPTNVTSQFGLD